MFASLLAGLFGTSDLLAAFALNGNIAIAIVAGIVFLETGCVILPFLPGDSLLFATGAFVSAGDTALAVAMLAIASAAVLGDGANYLIGRSAVGPFLIRKGWVQPRHLERGRAWFDRYGASTIIVGRFIPVVRTVAPFLAGLTAMPSRRFALYNLAGACLWSGSLLLAGYWLGRIDWVRTHIAPLSLAIVAVSLLPVLLRLRRGDRSRITV
jgi:membrane-associated protein